MKIVAFLLGFTALVSAPAAELRVAVLDFENRAGVSADTALIGGIQAEALAEKGVYVLGSVLANAEDFRLIDRRDFIGRIESIPERQAEIKPSFLRAAQALNADVVLRGILMSFAPGRQIIEQGGFRSEFVNLSLRVALQALDTLDGTVIAAADGAATQRVRQTDAMQTVIGEDELTDLMRSAVEDALPLMNSVLRQRIERTRERPKIKLSVTTDADPALVELNGMLIGTTPIVDFEMYKGDHVLTIGKAGYRDVNKRIMFESDTSIKVPMLRTELTADELKEVLETMRMNVLLGVPEPALIIDVFRSE